MTFNEFYAIAEQLFFDRRDNYWRIGDKNGLKWQWVTGGVTGGSCWSDDRHYARDADAEPEPSFSELDSLLELVCPSISFLIYRKISSDVMQRSDRCFSEYYENTTDCAIVVVEYHALYDALVQVGAITG